MLCVWLGGYPEKLADYRPATPPKQSTPHQGQNMQIISRAEAKAAASKRYFTDKPCKHGHVAERLTINGSCLECCRLKTLREYHENREENLRKQKIARSKPGYYEKKTARLHKRNPELGARVALQKQDAAAREAARAVGLSQYSSPRPCGQGHLGNRFVGDGHCVECNKINCRLRFGFLGRFAERNPEIASAKAAERAARAERKRLRQEERARRVEATQWWRDASQARRSAFESGAKTYIGSACKFGHSGIRYTKHGMCVECAATNAASDEKKRYDLIYYGRHQDRIRARSKRYHEKHRDRYVDQARAWVKRNPEKRKAISMAHKAKRRAIEKDGDPTSVIFAWVQKAPKVCYWCAVKCKTKYHVDHYKPLSRGGRHEVSNLVIACPTCNLRKNAKDPLEFAASVGRLF